MVRVFETEFAGRKLSIETGKYAEQANGSCIVRCDETAVMVNVTMAKQPREGIDFFPLNVEFEEKPVFRRENSGRVYSQRGKTFRKSISHLAFDRPAD